VSDGAAVVARVNWVANPYCGDSFEAAWLPAAEAALDYGATAWAFYRALDGMLDFTQLAYVASKLDFERYWYSEEISDARERASGLYQVPLLPTFHRIAGQGSLAPAAASAGSPAARGG
jgi:hypothetical protein